MNTFQIFGLQLVLSFVSTILIAKLYVYPRLKQMPVYNALIVMASVHIFRHIGLVFLMPSMMGAGAPAGFGVAVAYGDLAATVLALLSIWALYKRSSFAIPLVWIFNIIGLVDLLNAYYEGVVAHAWEYLAGFTTWYVPTFIVPLLVVSHLIIFKLLMKARQSEVQTI
jgi:hypothetical protein